MIVYYWNIVLVKKTNDIFRIGDVEYDQRWYYIYDSFSRNTYPQS